MIRLTTGSMAGTVLPTLFLIILSASFADAQTIRGRILLPGGFADRVEVILESTAQGVPIERVYSDNLGHFEFRGLQPGSYDIVVRHEEFVDVRQRAELGRGIASTAIVNFSLEPKAYTLEWTSGEYPVVDVAELNRNHPKKALDEYDKALEDSRKGNLAKAAERIENALTLAPGFYNARNTLGTIYHKMGRYRDAEREYEQARELNPRSADPLVNLGNLYIEEAEANHEEGRRFIGRILDKALDALEEAVKRNPLSVAAYYLLGTANYRSAFYEEAEASLKRALELDERAGSPRLMLANVYIRQHKWESVLEQLDAYLSHHPAASNRDQVEETRLKVVQALTTDSSQ